MLTEPLFGIYLHWPYCARVCPYCDFNVYAAKARDPAPLADALRADLRQQAEQTAARTVTSIYFGGGTPSLLPADIVGTIRSDILAHWAADPAIEVTLEANPEDVTPDRLKAWRDAGINRISLGVQSLSDPALRFLGRAHTTDDAKRAADAALSVFQNVSIDVIYARPGQSTEDWLAELSALLALGAPHLSLYELTIKEKTAFQKQVERFVFEPPDEDTQADLYLATLNATALAGLPAYEVSNHARNETFWSRHNMTYWLAGDWLGIGPGAEGRVTLNDTRYATRGALRPVDYIQSVQSGETSLTQQEILTAEQTADEALIMGLRSRVGVSRSRLETLYDRPLNTVRIDFFVHAGHLQENEGRLILTDSGWLLADYIASQILPENSSGQV